MKVPEIDWLLKAKEGENIEFKEAKASYSFDELAKYACGIANRGGGYFVLGVSDKRPRQVVGTRAFEQPERTRAALMDRLSVRIDFLLLEWDGKRVLVFEVPSRPVGIPIQDKGIAWWREGDSLVPMPMSEMRTIWIKPRSRTSGNDGWPSHKTLHWPLSPRSSSCGIANLSF